MTPPARIRTQVAIPLRFGGRLRDLRRAFTFEGLVDGGEHLALRLGERGCTPSPARPWSACTASA